MAPAAIDRQTSCKLTCIRTQTQRRAEGLPLPQNYRSIQLAVRGPYLILWHTRGTNASYNNIYNKSSKNFQLTKGRASYVDALLMIEWNLLLRTSQHRPHAHSLVFTARRYASAVYAVVVCPSDRVIWPDFF